MSLFEDQFEVMTGKKPFDIAVIDKSEPSIIDVMVNPFSEETEPEMHEDEDDPRTWQQQCLVCGKPYFGIMAECCDESDTYDCE